MNDQIHSDENVKLEVTMEEPETCNCITQAMIIFGLFVKKNEEACGLHTWIIGTEPEDNITVVRYRDCVFQWWLTELSMQQTTTIQIERMLQIDLLDIGVRRSAHANHVERCAMQMERMTQVCLLHCER